VIFQKSWNNVSIVSIYKRGNPSDCNNYLDISYINNGLKIIAKKKKKKKKKKKQKKKFLKMEIKKE